MIACPERKLVETKDAPSMEGILKGVETVSYILKEQKMRNVKILSRYPQLFPASAEYHNFLAHDPVYKDEVYNAKHVLMRHLEEVKSRKGPQLLYMELSKAVMSDLRTDSDFLGFFCNDNMDRLGLHTVLVVNNCCQGYNFLRDTKAGSPRINLFMTRVITDLPFITGHQERHSVLGSDIIGHSDMFYALHRDTCTVYSC